MKKSLLLVAVLSSPVWALSAPIVKTVAPQSSERVSFEIPGVGSLEVKEYRLKDSAIEKLATGSFSQTDLVLVRTVPFTGSKGSLTVAAASGAYVYDARSGSKQAPLQAVVVSRLSLAVTRDDERSVAFVHDRALAGVAGVSVRVVGGASGTTDAKGTVELASAKGALTYVASQGADVAIQKGDDRSFRWQPPRHLAQLTLDRGRYETKAPVHVRAVIREVREYGRDYWSPIGRAVELYRSDNTGARTLVASGKVSIYGTFSADLVAPTNTGEYALELDVAGDKRVALSSLSVGSATPSIPVTASASSYRAGDQASVSARVKPGSSVHFLVIRFARERAYSPWVKVAGVAPRNGGTFDSQVKNLDATAGSDGVARVSFATAKDADSDYFVEAQLGDAKGSVRFPVTLSDFEVRVATARNLHDLADPIVIRAGVWSVTGDSEGTPAKGARVTFSLVRIDEAGKAVSTPYTRWQDADATGSANLSLSASRSGKYRVSASVRDAAGRTSRSEREVFVHDGKLTWKPIYPEVIPDKDVYAVGDLATVLVLSPEQQGDALWSFGARELTASRGFVKLANGVGLFTTRITSDMVPNVFAQVLIPTAKGVAQGGREVVVPAADRLAVTVVGGGVALPGETRAITVRVRDAAGKPVRGEVQLSVVSEGVAAGPSLADAFFGPLTRGVDVAAPYWSSGKEPSDENPDGVAPPEVDLPRVRDVRGAGVAETLLWKTVVANTLGEATVSVALPGRASRWRIVARVASPWGQDVGEGRAALAVSGFTIDKAIAYWQKGATDFTFFSSMKDLQPWLGTNPHGRWVALQRSENGKSYFQVGENDLNHQDISIDAVTGLVTVEGEH